MSDPVTLEDIYAIFQRSQEEADRRFAEADRRAAESKAAFEQRMIEADKRLAKAEAIAAQANKAVNSLTSRWGQFVENLVAPGAIRMFRAKGIDVKEIHTRMKVKRGDINMEIDIFAVDDTEAVAIEVKSRLTQEAVKHFIQNLQKFKLAFPVYRDYQIYGAVAGIEIDEGADRYAYKQGLFVIRQSGDAVEIDNDDDFKPVTW